MLKPNGSESHHKQRNRLQAGTIIDQYVIERELAHGGFSSVYLARQLSDQIQVAIKEYLPHKLAHRAWNNLVVPNNRESRILFLRGRALFFEEAKVLAKLKHPNIVEVINFFKANDTVYMVMIYDYGITLDKLLSVQSQPVTEAFMQAVFPRLLNGVALIHQHQLLHLDIKPANILIRGDNNPLLLDFGAIRNLARSYQQPQSKVVTNGFSPAEQYHANGNLGPWSDIYSIGATMRTCLDVKAPQVSIERVKHDHMQKAEELYRKKYPKYLLTAIDWAMAPLPKDRPQSITELQAAISPANQENK